MRYKEFIPIEPLSNYIQLIWIIESESMTDYYAKERILPDGIVEIIFHYKDPFITHLADGQKFKQPKGFAVSQMKKFIEIESDKQIGFISVRFHPWGAYHFFNEPIKNFLDNTIDIKDLWKNDYQKILRKIDTANTDNERVNIVEQFLIGQINLKKKKMSNIDFAIKLIREKKGKLSVETLCNEINLSYKQLERKFLSTIGTTPKVFIRVTRFLHLCHHLNEYENRILTQLSYDFGYYDQSHFIKEFKEFAGLSPKEYFEDKNICFADF